MFLKEIFDRTLAILLLIIALPILFITALLIYIFMGRPIVFKQLRPGKNEQIFTIYKFRTMQNKFDKKGQLLPDNERLTNLGLWLRKLSIDELPQIINVLSGEMSFVGPRPLLPEYLTRYNAVQKKRHNVKPGITGLAQVTGRNSHSWEERLQQDTWYVENWSLALDFKIILLTLFKVFNRSGISAEGSATMPPFTGSSGEN
jgi:lipopolysaccharide/colanic/teichoic acid biosynthesis glycosyltransferase